MEAYAVTTKKVAKITIQTLQQKESKSQRVAPFSTGKAVKQMRDTGSGSAAKKGIHMHILQQL